MKTSAFARVDTTRLEGLIHDIDCFDYASERIFAASAMNTGQEGLGTGWTSITLRIKRCPALEGGEPKTLLSDPGQRDCSQA